MMGIDDAIDRLDTALVAAGLPALEPAPEVELLPEIERAVRPYALPNDLRRLWTRVDFSSLRALTWSLPGPVGPAAALATHRQNQEEAPLLFGPPLLFPIARASGDQWSVELASRWSDGGAVFSQADSTIRLEYPSLADLLDVYAELLERGAFVRWDNGYASFERRAEDEAREARLRDSAGRGLYGGEREFRDPRDWPPHWLDAAGMDLRDRGPLGTTHTVAELVRIAGAGAVHGRIAGRVVRLAGSGAGILATVEDGTER